MKKIKNPERFPANELLKLYRNKPVVYGNYYGEIIHIAYYDNNPIPFAEVQSLLDPEDTDIIPLNKVVLVSSVA